MEYNPARWNFPFILAEVSEIWSVFFSAILATLQMCNIESLISYIKQFCEMEGSPILSIFGSLNSIKMSIFVTPFIVAYSCPLSSFHCEILKIWWELAPSVSGWMKKPE